MEIDFNTENNLNLGFTSSVSMDESLAIGETPSGIDTVKVDGTPLPVINKSVNIDLATPLSSKADKSQIPTKTSQLTNDSGYITSASVPTKTSQLENDSGYITKDVDNLTYYTKTSDLPAPITIDSALSSSSTNPVQNQALYPAIVPTQVYKTVYTYDWTGPAGTNLYDCVAILTMPAGTFTDNSLVELVNADSFNTFAKHGFVLYGSEASSQRLWITSIGKPTGTVSLMFRIYKWGD